MPITPQEALRRTIEHREIFHDEMMDLMRRIMRGEVSPVMVSALLTGLRVKKETVGEITAAAMVLREFAVPVHTPAYPHLIDIVGTGGDSAHTFNISTAATFVAASCGAHVAKHGNRAVSSSTGAADVLEALGAAIELAPEQVAACLERTRVGFLYAPHHHPLMKVVAPVRRELGVRTLFNILGPLTNPASAPAILMGVFHPDLVGIQVRVLQRLGARRAMVVWGTDGLDEITLGAPTLVGELREGNIREYEIDPAALGVTPAARETLRVTSPEQSRTRVLDVLEGRPGPALDVVCLNAGAALYVAGLAESLAHGLSLARAATANGAARACLEAFVGETRRLKQGATQ